MKEQRTITFTGMTGRYDVPSFILSENSDLCIRLDLSPFRSSGLYRVTAIHGGSPVYVFTLTAKENEITLPASWLKGGGVEMLELSLKQYNAAGTVLINGGYYIEPLEIVALEGEYRATALLQASFENVKRLEQEWAERFEAFKSEVAGRLEASEVKTTQAVCEHKQKMDGTLGEFASRMEAMDEKLERVLSELEAEKGVKEAILSKMNSYVDNGIEVPFEEEQK